jgi:hypothetical protein
MQIERRLCLVDEVSESWRKFSNKSLISRLFLFIYLLQDKTSRPYSFFHLFVSSLSLFVKRQLDVKKVL